MDIGQIITDFITNFFANILNSMIQFFANILANIMSLSMVVLDMPLVKNGISYAQALAFALLVAKAANEAFQTYILYQSGDPDADPAGLVIRTAQATAVIAVLPWFVREVFNFGSKIASDVAGLNTGTAGISDWSFLLTAIVGTSGLIIIAFGFALVIIMLIVATQATIRGANLALMAVIGPIMALNLTANNRSIWSAWFRQLVVVCCSQAIQIFMFSGAISMLTNQAISGGGLLLVFGWLWATVKAPKFIQQFVFSTGFTGAIGGMAKQVGTMTIMRRMLVK